MTIYGIASVSTECVGHEDYADVEAIRPSRVSGDDFVYPPFFTKKEDAEKYIGDYKGYKIVLVDVFDGPFTLADLNEILKCSSRAHIT